MKYSKKELKNGISLHLINTDKFKTNLIAMFLSTSLTRENVTKNAVLSSVLRRGTQNLKTQEDISKKLEEMYGAEFNSGLDKIGKNHVLKFYIESVNDEYLPQNVNNMLKQSIDILLDVVLNPLVKDNKLNKEYVEQEKENIRQIIEAKKDNKAAYASFRCMEEMYKDSPLGLYKYGYIEDLKEINEQNLYDYYKSLIENCKIDIFVSGNLENINIEEIINQDIFSNLNERNADFNINKPDKKSVLEKERLIEESQEVTQGKLVIGYDLDLNDEMLNNIDYKYIGMVYNSILGGTANSKLFQNVREKESLAYTTNSNFSYVSGNVFVNAGIDIPNFKKALDISKKQVENMKNGDFDEIDIENAKKTIISNILSIDDEQDTEIIYFLGQALSEKKVTLEEYVDMINKVKKEQIVEFAKMVKINTIYFLKN